MSVSASGAAIVARWPVYAGWYRLWRLRVRMPDGAEVERHLEDHGTAAAVLPYDPDRRVALLVSMPRAPVIDAGLPPILEAIAGNLDGTAENTVRGEAAEEAGVRLDTLEPVATVWSLVALSTERLYLFLAPYRATDRTGPGGGSAAEHENITVHELPLARLRAMRLAGSITDAKTLLLLQALELARPALFT